MSRLTRDGTAELVSRDQILGANGDREIFFSPVQLTTSRIDNLTRLILTLLATIIDIFILLNSIVLATVLFKTLLILQ